MGYGIVRILNAVKKSNICVMHYPQANNECVRPLVFKQHMLISMWTDKNCLYKQILSICIWQEALCKEK